jgi:hypothetical protein
MRAPSPQPSDNRFPMKTVYEVQIKSLCPPQAFLRLEAHDNAEAADLTHRFLRNGCSEDFDNVLRILHLPLEDAIGCGQYEIGSIRPVEVIAEPGFPILKRWHKALETSVEEMEADLPQDDGDPHGSAQFDKDRLIRER